MRKFNEEIFDIMVNNRISIWQNLKNNSIILIFQDTHMIIFVNRKGKRNIIIENTTRCFRSKLKIKKKIILRRTKGPGIRLKLFF